MSQKKAASSTRNLQQLLRNGETTVPPKSITPHPANPRFGNHPGISVAKMMDMVRDESDYGALLESVKNNGVIKALLVVMTGKAKFELRCGLRRWCAAIDANLSEVRVIILPADATDREIDELMLIEEGGQKKPWHEFCTWLHQLNLFNKGKSIDLLAIENATSVDQVKLRFIAVAICQEYLANYPDSGTDVPWSNVFEALKSHRKKKKLEVALKEDPAFKAAMFRQMHSGEIRVSHNARILPKIACDPGLVALFIEEGFQAALSEIKSSTPRNDGERLGELCKPLERFIAAHPEVCSHKIVFHKPTEKTVTALVLRIAAFYKKAGLLPGLMAQIKSRTEPIDNGRKTTDSRKT